MLTTQCFPFSSYLLSIHLTLDRSLLLLCRLQIVFHLQVLSEPSHLFYQMISSLLLCNSQNPHNYFTVPLICRKSVILFYLCFILCISYLIWLSPQSDLFSGKKYGPYLREQVLLFYVVSHLVNSYFICQQCYREVEENVQRLTSIFKEFLRCILLILLLSFLYYFRVWTALLGGGCEGASHNFYKLQHILFQIRIKLMSNILLN